MRTSETTRAGLTLIALGAAACLVSHADAQFTSNNVTLYDWLDLAELGTGASSGNDCWGYVSPSGREYALMGVSNALVVVEITDPSMPVIVASVSHTDTLWGDVKTYQEYAYVVNDYGGGGMDLIDLSDVDNGNVELVQRLSDGGLSTSHNVAIDTDSGYLYLCGSNLAGGRLVACDLSDPANPVLVGSVNSFNGVYVHDAQIVTYTSGPYAGQQIAFCANGGTGLDIYDVTNKLNMFRLSRTTYPNLAYAHQVWLSDDRQYLYLNDELDNVNETVIFDVSDLSNPVIVGTSTSGVAAFDHNIYFHDGYVYEAEYRAGLRVFCAADPENPVEVGWFDTYPESDDGDFFGAWSVYPFFPSGTVIVSDMNRGLFILDVTDALSAGSVVISQPQGLPELLDPAGGTTVTVQLEAACGGSPAGATATLHYDAGGGFTTLPMELVAADTFEAAFPALACPSQVAYYISVDVPALGTFTDPPDAPASTYCALVAIDITTVFQDNFNTDLGWVAENLGATSGDWQRGVPVDDPNWSYDPSSDGDGSGMCYLTQNEVGNTDVDDGSVRLNSPVFDMSQGNLTIAYEYFLRLTEPNGNDPLVLEASSNGASGPWTEIARHDTNGGLAWQHHEILPADLAAAGVAQTSTMEFRFTITDGEPQSIVEGGVDGFSFVDIDCASVAGDLDGDGLVGVSDLLIMLGAWGACPQPCPPSCPADLNGDCQVAVEDVLILLANWTL